MKPDKLIREYRNHPKYNEILNLIVSMHRQGYSIDDIEQKVVETYGEPFLLQWRKSAAPLSIIGDVGLVIDAQTHAQMASAMKLPVAIRGALMPDAHFSAASIPVGGAVLLENAISPSMIGPDISCSIMLTRLAGIDKETAIQKKEELLTHILRVTHFGPGKAQFKDGRERDHEVMDDEMWNDLPISNIKDLARSQLGSSGGGNHFVDIAVFEEENGKSFVALVSHSGSRGAGAKIAHYYKKKAQEYVSLASNNTIRNHEWLDLGTELGQDYLHAMQLMGRYAKANHELIHKMFLLDTGLTAEETIYTRHNYAWVTEQGVLHRKGAMPAEKGVKGIIPGSCASPIYIVKGLGNDTFLNTASHGAGRLMSRKAAKDKYDEETVQEAIREFGVLTYGVAKDENPFAYKNIDHIVRLQVEAGVVEVVNRGKPIVVVMGG